MMRNPRFLVSALALAATFATPALAESRADRARAAIATAQAKVDIAEKLGASGEVPRLQADAASSLRVAKEQLARSQEEEAFAAANRAATLAEQAIGISQQNQSANAQAQTAAAVNARAQTDAAAGAAAAAQQDAAAANARAAAAEQAAATAQADAAAARAAPPPAPAPTTTVTTETVKTAPAVVARPATRRVVKRTTTRKPVHRATVTEKTTTTVKTSN